MDFNTTLKKLQEKLTPEDQTIPKDISNMYRTGVDSNDIIKFLQDNHEMTKEEAIRYYRKLANAKGRK